MLVFTLMAPFVMQAQKTDTVFHINGNVLTGDFKKMAYGVVTWKMDGMGTINLEEVKINTIRSAKLFEIKLKSGNILFGSFDASDTPRKVFVVTEDQNELINMEQIVEIFPLKRSFWMRTSGNFSLAGNYSKGSNIGTIGFSGNLSYVKRKTYFELSVSDNNTYQGDSLSSSNSEISFAWQRELTKSWSSEISVGTTQNTELGTKLRLNLNMIGIRDITYNSWNRFYAGAGLSVSDETPYDESPGKADLAGLFQVVWKVYKYTLPKLWVDASLNFLPYLTERSRYLATLNLNPQVSILGDNLKLGFKFYYSIDSKPASTSASNTDYGINLELTYSFH